MGSGSARVGGRPEPGAVEFSAELARLDDAVWCRERCRRLALAVGFEPSDAWRVSIAVSELVTNAVEHGRGGWLRAIELHRPTAGVEIVIEDRGPGIDDPALALADRFSRGHFLDEEIWVHRRSSLGSGLGAVRRMMDELVITRGAAGGAAVVVRKWVPPRR